jgi:methylmalonyl-CoA decarboxylase subunit alpha
MIFSAPDTASGPRVAAFDPFEAGLPSCRLSARERLELLCDVGSVAVLRSRVRSRRMGEKARCGDGVVGATGLIDGRPVFCYAQDASFAGGSLGEAHADTIVKVLRLAGEVRAPVIAFVESGGARMQEGVAALGGYARIFRETVALSGRVPQISVVCGNSAGGGSYSPALTDFVVMTDEASMFLTGPAVVAEVLGERVGREDLGGPRVHGRNGVSHFRVPTDIDSVFLVRELLSFLPQNAWVSPPRSVPAPPVEAVSETCVPADARRVYDVRTVVRGVVDDSRMVESAPRWARNIVTAFARIDGRPVGVIANQPSHLGGVIDADASQKAARFVRCCNAFGLPLVVFVDTPGFMPGTKQEQAGVIRHGAKLLHAFAEASVPKLTVILRKAYGGAYITMNSKDLGAHYVYAWPCAEIGIMGARQAVGIIHRRALADAAEASSMHERLAAAYADEHLQPWVAAREGFVDEVIEPPETRASLTAALRSLDGTIGRCGDAGNIPL